MIHNKAIERRVSNPSWVLSLLTSNAIFIAIEAMRIGSNHLKIAMGNLFTIEVRRRRRNTHRRISTIAIA